MNLSDSYKKKCLLRFRKSLARPPPPPKYISHYEGFRLIHVENPLEYLNIIEIPNLLMLFMFYLNHKR